MQNSRQFFSLRVHRNAVALGAGFFAVLFSGCSLQPSAGKAGPSSYALNSVAGKAMGGNAPIGNGTVTLYSTTAAGSVTIVNGVYTGSATVLGTTSTATDGTGDFTFSSVASCTAGSQVYVTISGGDTGGGANTNILLGSMLGPCGSVAPFTVVNEASTIAMAYAMGSFTTIDGSGNVNVVAPAANSSTAATNDVSSGTVSTASGLAHAYANFLNLVNVPNGAALAAPVSNAAGIAPQAVVNALASILQVCVNSNGVGGSSSNCSSLFAAAPALDGTSPANTFQAALNIARNPAGNVAGLYGLLTGIGAAAVYSPVISSQPKDWTLAIAYPVPPNPVTGVGFPFTVALDADDNVYITSPENDVYVPTTTATTTKTSNSACLFGFSSNGSLRTSVTPYSGTPGSGTPGTSSWYCSSGSASTAPTLLTQLAADALGNVWMTNLGSTSTYNEVLQVNTGSPSTATAYINGDTSAPKAIVVDKENDVFFSHNSSSGTTQSIYYVTAGGASGSPAISSPIFATPSVELTQATNWLALDSSQNMWATGYSDTQIETGTYPGYGGAAALLPYAGTPGSPAYGNTWQKKNMAGGSTSTSQENSAPFGVAIDGAGNAWYTTDAPANGGTAVGVVGLTEADVNSSGALQNTNPSNTLALGLVSPKWLEADGNNVMWVADTGGIVAYATTASPAVAEISESGGFNPCIAPKGTTTCTYPDNTSTKGIAVDSTGSVWWTTPDSTTTNANANDLIQLIGTASATWPLLATGKPGTMPQ